MCASHTGPTARARPWANRRLRPLRPAPVMQPWTPSSRFSLLQPQPRPQRLAETAGLRAARIRGSEPGGELRQAPDAWAEVAHCSVHTQVDLAPCLPGAGRRQPPRRGWAELYRSVRPLIITLRDCPSRPPGSGSTRRRSTGSPQPELSDSLARARQDSEFRVSHDHGWMRPLGPGCCGLASAHCDRREGTGCGSQPRAE
jgi:hypothetical protein